MKKLKLGALKQIGFRPNLHPKFVFCASAVALGCFNAGRIPNERMGKCEPDAYYPEILFEDPNLEIIYPSNLM